MSVASEAVKQLVLLIYTSATIEEVSETYRWSADGPPLERIVWSASPSASRNGRRQQEIDVLLGTHSENSKQNLPNVSDGGVTKPLGTLRMLKIKLDDQCTIRKS